MPSSMPHGATRAIPCSSDILMVIAMSAARAQCTPEEWLESRLSACAGIEAGESALPGWNAEILPLIRSWALEGHALDETAIPCMGLVLHGLKARAERENEAEPVPELATVDVETRFCHRLFDEEAISKAKARVTEREHLVHFRALLESGNYRFLPRMGDQQNEALHALLLKAPHLSAATNAVIGALAIARRREGRLRLPPILLEGPPGVGKTWWVQQVAMALGVPQIDIQMPSVTASFVLSGSTPAWSHARPGRIVEGFFNGDSASPLFLFDELDKVAEGNYPPESTLLGLLEPHSARRWHDEFFGTTFDVSEALIIATCNDSRHMDRALRSRFLEIRARLPMTDELPSLIESAWDAHRSRYEGLALPPQLSKEMIEGLVSEGLNMRMLARRFDSAIARAAARDGDLLLIPADFGGRSARLVNTC